MEDAEYGEGVKPVGLREETCMRIAHSLVDWVRRDILDLTADEKE
jgi:hypothetical protein